MSKTGVTAEVETRWFGGEGTTGTKILLGGGGRGPDGCWCGVPGGEVKWRCGEDRGGVGNLDELDWEGEGVSVN